ncbi:MAG: DUF4783 domain-containing protein [Bacteroidota bacterium]|nr:DUF4783 domain-containing protein [Bacteroidota bacterium]
MKSFCTRGLVILAFLGAFFIVKADILDDIAAAMRSGNAQAVATYFGSSVDMKILDASSSYSRNQAEQVLNEFFKANSVKSYTTVFRGTSAKGAQYSIGEMETTTGNYRTHYCIKEVAGKLYIQQLNIERQ